MNVITMIASASPVEAVIFAFIAMNTLLSGTFVLQRGVAKIRNTSSER
ncbi:MAG: hypothetical protein DHS20C05_19380 [Hyphococcus sp.]|nr:MAG: hypothetical protein DHS20C05_19380 [Marinicaulis sp.]